MCRGVKYWPQLSKEMDVSSLRIPYSSVPFLEEDLVSKDDPINQFKSWFQTALHSGTEEQPNAACLSTCTTTGYPSSRMLLVKKFDEQGFTFFTNYDSRKGKELIENPNACLLFFWSSLHRQVRIEGTVSKLSQEESEQYFNSRPLGSRISATVSPQSREIASRESLQAAYNDLESKLSGDDDSCASLTKPATWGGFTLKPLLCEFWQGQTNRLHDRIVFTKHSDGTWTTKRLAP